MVSSEGCWRRTRSAIRSVSADVVRLFMCRLPFGFDVGVQPGASASSAGREARTNSLRVAEDRIDDGFAARHVDVDCAGEEMSAFGGTADGIDISIGAAVPIMDPAVSVAAGNAAQRIE